MSTEIISQINEATKEREDYKRAGRCPNDGTILTQHMVSDEINGVEYYGMCDECGYYETFELYE